jgi:hypothetical protein
MKCFDQVILVEYGVALHVGGEVHHVRQGVPVQHDDGVELPVVTAGPPCAVGRPMANYYTILYLPSLRHRTPPQRLAGSSQHALANTSLLSVRM